MIYMKINPSMVTLPMAALFAGSAWFWNGFCRAMRSLSILHQIWFSFLKNIQ